MDLGVLLLLIVLGLVAQAVFWGGLVAMVVKLLKTGGRQTGLPYSQGPWANPTLGTRVGRYEPGPWSPRSGPWRPRQAST